MKLAILVVLLSGVTWMAAIAAAPDIQVLIAHPRDRYRERALQYSLREHFQVILKNSSDTPKRIWKESCSWGYFALSFELTDESGKTWTAKKKGRAWSKNYQDYWTVAAHESLVLDVEFANADVWDGFSPPSSISRKLKMRAIFEIPSDKDSEQYSVWTGRASSEVEEYVFYK